MSWSIAGVVRERAGRASGDVVLRDLDETITAGELDVLTNRVANALIAAGQGPGDRVGYLGRNRLAYYQLLFGAAKAGCVPVGVNWRLAEEQLAEVLADAGIRWLVVGEDAVALIPQIERARPGIEVVIAGERGGPFSAWRDAASADDPGHEAGPGDDAVQIYTSGTTGASKGVVLSHGAIAATLAVSHRWHLVDGAVALVNLPLFHFGGSVWAVQAIANGGQAFVHAEVDADLVVSQSRDILTTAIAVPTMLLAYCDAADRLGGPFPSLRCLGYGSAPIRESLLLRVMQTFDCDLLQTYGMTESAGVMTQLLPEEHDPAGPRKHLLRSAGRPVPGVELHLGDPHSGSAAGVREVSDLWARTPWTMSGYWNRPDQTREAVVDGWLRTGDIGYLDGDGYLYLTDRATDMIITGGENVYPAEVENVLLEHADIIDAAAIGLPHERWGEQVAAAVVARPGAVLDEDEVIAFARARLAHYKCPARVLLADELPRNETGKLLRRDVRAGVAAEVS